MSNANNWAVVEAALRVLLDKPGSFDAAVFALAALGRLRQHAQEREEEIARLRGLVEETIAWFKSCGFFAPAGNLHARLTAEAKPEAPVDGDAFFDVWRCSSCGDSQLDSSDPRWRWNGEIWEHKCGDPQAGYFPARNFGKPIPDAPAPVRCRNCGHAVHPEWCFCTVCGAAWPAGESAPSPRGETIGRTPKWRENAGNL